MLVCYVARVAVQQEEKAPKQQGRQSEESRVKRVQTPTGPANESNQEAGCRVTVVQAQRLPERPRSRRLRESRQGIMQRAKSKKMPSDGCG